MEPDPQGENKKLLYPDAKPFWATTWEFLMKHRDQPCAVCAPYTGPSPWNNIYVFRIGNKNNHLSKLHWSIDQYSREDAARMGGISECVAGPTGLIIYDMRVFEKMRKPYFDYEFKGDGAVCEHCGERRRGPCEEKASTEDVYQTRNMTLEWYATGGQVGGKLYCNWDAWARHIKLEHIDKPRPFSIDNVSMSLRDAVLRGQKGLEKLVLFDGGDIESSPEFRECNGEAAGQAIQGDRAGIQPARPC